MGSCQREQLYKSPEAGTGQAHLRKSKSHQGQQGLSGQRCVILEEEIWGWGGEETLLSRVFVG